MTRTIACWIWITLLGACSLTKESTSPCDEQDCPPPDAALGDAGPEAGLDGGFGDGGFRDGGGRGGSSGTGGGSGNGGAGGAGDGGTTDPCAACMGTTSACTDQGECVECLKHSDCNAGVCDLTAQTCVGCRDDGDCGGDQRCQDNACVGCIEDGDCPGACDTSTNTCVECLHTDDCGNDVCRTNPTSSMNRCVECLSSDDCPDGVCNPDNHACVACLKDSDCSGGVCVEATHSCVGCLEDGDCAGGVCDTDRRECVACLEDADCPGVCLQGDASTTADNQCADCRTGDDCGGATPYCDLSDNTCAECTDHDHCTDAGAARCGGDNTCQPCEADHECDGIPGTNLCDEGDGTCVECTGTEYGACGENDEGEAFVCDSLSRTCSGFLEGRTAACGELIDEPEADIVECVSDAQCREGQLCVMQRFQLEPNDEVAEIGYFCFWRRDDSEGAVANCTSARPYVDTLSGQTSIDGVQTTICGLRVTTCPALDDFSDSEVDCAPEGEPDDSGCGDPEVDDGLCRLWDEDYACTTRCLSLDDCKVGSTCVSGPDAGSPDQCSF